VSVSEAGRAAGGNGDPGGPSASTRPAVEHGFELGAVASNPHAARGRRAVRADEAAVMMGSSLLFVVIGLAAGLLSGVFGIGGGVVIVPALIYLAGFTQHSATGTSLAVLLPPIGLAAMWEYYRHGDVNVRAAMIIAAAVFVGGWAGALI